MPFIYSGPHDTRVHSRSHAGLGLPTHPRLPPLSPSQGEFNAGLPVCHSKLPYVGLMRPRNQALFHPAAIDLLAYATDGCPVNCGKDWTLQQMQAAIDRGSHPSAQHHIVANACRQEALA